METSYFQHRFEPAIDANAPTLLLLHGTGGDETDLLELGRAMHPGAALLSPRGRVLENRMPRFFRRLSEGVFDLDDLRVRAAELSDFLVAASGTYGFNPKEVIAVGYSNGANIAASLLLLHPGVLAAAVLYHAMIPLTPETLPDLSRIPVFIGAGRGDSMIRPAETEALEKLLRQAGAQVTMHWEQSGHGLNREEVQHATEWLQTIVAKHEERL